MESLANHQSIRDKSNRLERLAPIFSMKTMKNFLLWSIKWSNLRSKMIQMDSSMNRKLNQLSNASNLKKGINWFILAGPSRWCTNFCARPMRLRIILIWILIPLKWQEIATMIAARMSIRNLRETSLYGAKNLPGSFRSKKMSKWSFEIKFNALF